MRKIMNKVSIFLILFIFSVNSKIHLSQDNFLLSSSLTEANAASDYGGAEANSNSDSSVSLSKNSNFLKGEDINNYKGDSIIGLSDSKSKALTDLGNAKATSTSNASASKNEKINNDDTSDDNIKITNSNENSDVVLAAANSKSYAATKKGDASSVAVANTNVYDNSSINKNKENGINYTNINNPILNFDCIEYNWTDLEIAANYISVNANGTLYYLDLGGYLYRFEFVGKRSHKIKGRLDSIDDTQGEGMNQDSTYLRNLNKIIAGAINNDIFVISKYGDGYYYGSIKEKWMKIDGCIWDIAFNRNRIVYKLGCDYDENGYSLYRYICNQLYILDFEEYGTNSFYEFKENDECFWLKLDFRANRISINNDGILYFVDNKNAIYSYDENTNNLNKLNTEIKVKDFSISNDGSLFIVGIDHIIYKITINEEGQSDSDIECFKSNATAISVGPMNLPFIISENGKVLFSSKFPFN